MVFFTLVYLTGARPPAMSRICPSEQKTPLAEDSDENTSISPWLEKSVKVSVTVRGGTKGFISFSNSSRAPLPVTSHPRQVAAVVMPTSKLMVSVPLERLKFTPMPQAVARAMLPALFSTSHSAPSDPWKSLWGNCWPMAENTP